MHKGFKCLKVANGRIYIPRDMVFDENIYPFSKLHSNAGAKLRAEIVLLSPSLLLFDLSVSNVNNIEEPLANCPNPGNQNSSMCSSVQISISPGTEANGDLARLAPAVGMGGMDTEEDMAHGCVTTGGTESDVDAPALRAVDPGIDSPRPAEPTALEVFDSLRTDQSQGAFPGSSMQPISAPVAATRGRSESTSSLTQQNQSESVQRPVTRLSKGIKHPCVYTNGTIRYGMLTITGEPSSLSVALSNDNWKYAMDIEFDALVKK
jgi:hypothetical protein